MNIPLVRFLVFSNIWVSFACSSLTSLFFAANHIDVSYSWMGFVFCNTFIAYNLQRLLKEKWPNESDHFQWLDNNKNTIYVLMFIAALFSVYITVQLSLPSLLLIITVGLLSIFYSGNWNKKGKNLRQIPYLKIYLIALSWSTMIVLLPWSESGFPHLYNNLALFLAVFIYIVGMTIPFDIRDLKFDYPHQKTIPQLLGTQKARYLSACLAAVAFIYFVVKLHQGNIAFISVCLVSLVVLFRSEKKKPELYFSGLVEGLILLLGVSVLMD